MTWSTSDSARLKRVFGADIPIVEATMALSVVIQPRNMKGATKDSAVCCAIAKALGGKDIAIMQTTAYIREGRKVVKYSNGDDAKSFIKMFDKSGLRLTAPMAVTFLPVPPSHKRVACKRRHRALAARIKSGKAPRAYVKPTAAKGSKVRVYQPHSHRTVVVDGRGRCATRYHGL